jgi:Domain of unknown function (DUF4129)
MRQWTEFVADVADHVPGGVPGLTVILVGLTGIVTLLWYYWPDWLPGQRDRRARSRRSTADRSDRVRPGLLRSLRSGRLRLRWRWRWRRRRRRSVIEADANLAADQLPDLPASLLIMTADQLAAAGRYAEAVRERLRGMVRDLIERGLIPFTPGWTVTELGAAAVAVQPALAGPLGSAGEIFSRIWYGQQPAERADDLAMRGYAVEVAGLASRYTPAPVAAGGAR